LNSNENEGEKLTKLTQNW